MNIMVIGGGGREHAIIHALRKSPRVTAVYALPGNGGIAQEATCVPIAATDIDGAVTFAKANAIDFAVVAPDDPLVLGMVNALQAAGIRCFGPDKKAAVIEGSKAFSKDLMRRYGIPTAGYATFDDEKAAITHVQAGAFPVVIKADGLALGKGVVIAQNEGEAIEAIHNMMSGGQFGESGKRIVVEEYLTGPEITVLAFTDGTTVVPMTSSMDHKRALDGDKGLNTGGMGVIAPNPFYTEAIAAECMETIYLPTIRAMQAEGRPFKGCLYFGLMLTEDGPKVIEYNCRFGDPEAQAVLPLLETDLLTVFEAVENGTLATVDVRFRDEATCCLMLVSGGYPGAYAKGKSITVGELPEGVTLYHSGTACENGQLVTAGGRVLGVTATAETLAGTVALAYQAAKQVHFDGMFYRNDIGKRALEA